MRIMGIDPGKTFGVACLETKQDSIRVLETYQLEFDPNALQDYTTLKATIQRNTPDVVVIEDVVKSGRLNSDKIVQTRAFERIFCLVHSLLPMIRPELVVVSPQVIKHGRPPIPPEVKGRHARDAFCLAVYYCHKWREVYEPSKADAPASPGQRRKRTTNSWNYNSR